VSDPSTVLCRRCGTPNVAGDQFCGSCGAFLEWEGASVVEPAPEPGPADAALPAIAGPAAPAAVETSGAGAPGSPTSPSAPVAPSGSSTGTGSAGDRSTLVRCPACGIANPTGRTFCQSCGTTLPADARVDVSAATAAWVASGAPKPTPVVKSPGAGAAAAGGSGDGKPKKEAQASGGIPGWVIAMVVLGLLVGVGAVVVPQFLAPEVPSEATSAPSLPPRVTQTPTQAPNAVPTPEPPSALALLGATASSVIGNREKFSAGKAIDGDRTTSWQEGAADEAGQWLEVTFEAARVDALVIWNGYQESEAAYFANRRVRDVRITFDTGQAFEARLEDTMEPFRVGVAGVTGATRVRIEIVTTYDPRATEYPGSPFDDCAVSEIQVLGVPVP
jgi:hypothetical protein